MRRFRRLGAVAAAAVAVAACGPRRAPVPLYYAAESAMRRGQLEEAVDGYRLFIEQPGREGRPYLLRSYYMLALALHRLGRNAEAAAALEELEDKYPEADSVQVWALRGDISRAEHKLVEAVQQWERAWHLAGPLDRQKLQRRVRAAMAEMDAGQVIRAASLVREPGVREILLSQTRAGEGALPLEGGAAEPAAGAAAEAPAPPGVACLLAGAESGAREDGERIATAVRLGFGEAADRVRTVFAGLSAESLRAAWLRVAVDPSVLAVIASASDAVAARALAELADTAAVPLLLVSPEGIRPGAYTRSLAGGEQEFGKLLDYAVDRARLHRFAIVYEETPAGRSGMQQFAAEAKRKGAEVVAAHGYSGGQEASVLQEVHAWRARQRNVEAIYFSAGPAAAALAAGVQSKFPDLILLGPAEWGVPVVAAQWRELRVFVPGSSDRGAFAREFEAAAGQPAGIAEVRAHQAALLLRRAIVESEARTREEVHAFLDSPEGLAGGSEPAVLQVRDGRVETAS